MDTYKGIWVFVETEQGYTQKVSYELISKGKALAEEKKCRMTAVVIGSDIDAVIGEAAAYGADQIIAVDAPVYEYYSTDGYAVTMTELIRKYRPETVLIGATDNGRDLAPRIACALQTGLTADCTGIGIDAKTGCIAWTRPTFGGNLMATIICPTERRWEQFVRECLRQAFMKKRKKEKYLKRRNVK